MNKNRAIYEVTLFFALTLGASYFIFWGPLAIFQIPTISFVSSTRGPGWAIALFIFNGFVPSLTALLLTAIFAGKEGLRQMSRRILQLKIGGRWYLAVLGIVLVGTLGQILIIQALGETFQFKFFLTQLGSFPSLLILGPLSEELGWRGYAQDRLQTRWNPITSSIILGTLWGFWHLPLFFMVGTSQHELSLPFLPFLLTLIALSILFSWLHNHTGRAIWTAIFFHWIYTYFAQVVSSVPVQAPVYQWLKPVPYLLMAVIVVAIWLPRLRPTEEKPGKLVHP